MQKLNVKFPQGNCDQIPAGYEAVSLIEALNGPCMIRQVPCMNVAETPNSESAIQAAEMLNRYNYRDFFP